MSSKQSIKRIVIYRLLDFLQTVQSSALAKLYLLILRAGYSVSLRLSRSLFLAVIALAFRISIVPRHNENEQLARTGLAS